MRHSCASSTRRSRLLAPPEWATGMTAYFVNKLMGKLVTLARTDWNGVGFEVAYIVIRPLFELQCRADKESTPDFKAVFRTIPAGQVDEVECSALTVISRGYARNFFYIPGTGWWFQTSIAWLDPWSWNVAFFRVDASVAPPAQ